MRRSFGVRGGVGTDEYHSREDITAPFDEHKNTRVPIDYRYDTFRCPGPPDQLIKIDLESAPSRSSRKRRTRSRVGRWARLGENPRV